MAKLRTLISDIDCPEEFPHINLNLCEGCILKEQFQEAMRKADEALKNQVFNMKWENRSWTGGSTGATVTFTPNTTAQTTSLHAHGTAWDGTYTNSTVDDLHFTISGS